MVGAGAGQDGGWVVTVIIDKLEYTDGNSLATSSNWTTDKTTGTATPESDKHDGAPNQVIDMSDGSTITSNFNTNSLGSADQDVTVPVVLDVDPDSDSRGGPILRASGTGTSEDYYSVVVKNDTTTGDLLVVWERWASGSNAETLQTVNLSSAWSTKLQGGRHDSMTVRARIEDTVIKAWVNGTTVGSYDTASDGTKISTGDYCGFQFARIDSSVYAQPYVPMFFAYSADDTNQTRQDWDNIFDQYKMFSTGTNESSITFTGFDTPTADRELIIVAHAHGQSSKITGIGTPTDDGTGTWSLVDDYIAESGDLGGAAIFTKTAGGDETSITITRTGGNGSWVVTFIELNPDYSYETAGLQTSDDVTSVTTGTLSSDDKIGIGFSMENDPVASTDTGSRFEISDDDWDHLLTYARFNSSLNTTDSPTSGANQVGLKDLGTATTAWTFNRTDTSGTNGDPVMGYVIIAKTPSEFDEYLHAWFAHDAEETDGSLPEEGETVVKVRNSGASLANLSDLDDPVGDTPVMRLDHYDTDVHAIEFGTNEGIKIHPATNTIDTSVNGVSVAIWFSLRATTPTGFQPIMWASDFDVGNASRHVLFVDGTQLAVRTGFNNQDNCTGDGASLSTDTLYLVTAYWDPSTAANSWVKLDGVDVTPSTFRAATGHVLDQFSMGWYTVGHDSLNIHGLIVHDDEFTGAQETALADYLGGGTTNPSGSGSVTAADDTGSGSGTFTPPPVSGSGTPSLEASTGSGSGTHTAPSFSGSSAVTAADDTGSGSGTFTVPVYSGSVAVTAGDATAVGSGTHTAPVFSGSGSPSAEDATGSGSGTHTDPQYSGSGSITAADATGSGSGTFTPPPVSSSASVTLEDFTGAGTGFSGTPTWTGSGTPTAGDATAAGSGTFVAPVFEGSSSVSAEDFTGSGSGTFTSTGITGSGSPSAEDFTGSGSGTFTPAPVSGSGSPTLEDFTGTGSGTEVGPQFTGSASVSLSDATAAGSGTYALPTRSGTGDADLEDVTASGVGVYTPPPITGSVSVTLDDFTGTAGGTITGIDKNANADITAEDFTATGAGTRTVPVLTGAGAITLTDFTTGLEGIGRWNRKSTTNTALSMTTRPKQADSTLEDLTR